MITLHTIDVRIYYEDTDAGGIVYYANYLKFFERSRSDWLWAQGIDHRQLAAQGLGLVVQGCSIEYQQPARLDDLLAVDTGILDARLDIRRASIRLQHRARRHDSDRPLATGQVRVACIEQASGRPAPLPEAVFGQLHHHARTLSPQPGDAG